MDYPGLFRMVVNVWPPYLGAGITVEEIADDWRTIRVAMKLRWYNRNYVKSHFGGNLFSMTDPFFMLMLLGNLGPDYVVWDLAAEITFLRPGLGKVSAVFTLDARRIDEIRTNAASGNKITEVFLVEITDEEGERVATVKKNLYIRKKISAPAPSPRDNSRLRTDEKHSPLILSSGWGKIEIAGIGPGKDWKLWPGGGRGWDWAEHGTGHHRGVQCGDVQELVEKGCRTVILTTGRLGRLRVPDSTVTFLQDQGVEVVVTGTAKGIELYNDLAGRNTAIGGLFHSTC